MIELTREQNPPIEDEASHPPGLDLRGHSFVVHGRMESVLWDAAIIPTDTHFSVVHRNWGHVVGGHASALKPQGWGVERRFGRVTDGRPLWFVNVTAPSTGQPSEMLRDLKGALEEIARNPPPVRMGRCLPLVAVPVVGIGRGGLGRHTGEVVRGLLRLAQEVSAARSIDIVIVATRASAFAAFQSERRSASDFPDLNSSLYEEACELGEMASEGRLALLIGAGVSIPAGLPSWTQLVEEMRDVALATEPGLDDEEHFNELGVLDQAELLQRVMGPDLAKRVARRAANVPSPALGHLLLAGLRCKEVVTTNYDTCFEMACSAQGRGSFRILPWERPEPSLPWVLKIHGDADHEQTIVLTRGQFVGYDRRWGPAGSLFQSILLTKHLLVVGASLTDDNILRLAHEAKRFREDHGVSGGLGTVLTLGDEPLRGLLWKDELSWVGMGSGSSEVQARRLEIFLDAVSVHACADSSYLLDVDFEALIPDEERSLAADARALADQVAALDETSRARWSALDIALRNLGARPPGALR